MYVCRAPSSAKVATSVSCRAPSPAHLKNQRTHVHLQGHSHLLRSSLLYVCRARALTEVVTGVCTYAYYMRLIRCVQGHPHLPRYSLVYVCRAPSMRRTQLTTCCWRHVSHTLITCLQGGGESVCGAYLPGSVQSWQECDEEGRQASAGHGSQAQRDLGNTAEGGEAGKKLCHEYCLHPLEASLLSITDNQRRVWSLHLSGSIAFEQSIWLALARNLQDRAPEGRPVHVHTPHQVEGAIGALHVDHPP